jgi:hypothetical protein
MIPAYWEVTGENRRLHSKPLPQGVNERNGDLSPTILQRGMRHAAQLSFREIVPATRVGSGTELTPSPVGQRKHTPQKHAAQRRKYSEHLPSSLPNASRHFPCPARLSAPYPLCRAFPKCAKSCAIPRSPLVTPRVLRPSAWYSGCFDIPVDSE